RAKSTPGHTRKPAAYIGLFLSAGCVKVSFFLFCGVEIKDDNPGNCRGKKIANNKTVYVVGFVVLLSVLGVLIQCNSRTADGVLDPKASLDAMVLADGFDIALVAAEPLVMAPVAMTFDGQGRMWVVEMDGYMPDTLGTGEDRPVGRIAILDDTDDDGQADSRVVFLDSLVMPRALCLIGGG